MANYTIELRDLVEKYHFQLALNDYPIFDENYRPLLNRKIIEHFYFREIGMETPDRFNFYLRRKLNEIMPYYNKLYQSELLQFDPLATEYIEEGTKRERASKTKGTSGDVTGLRETTGDVFTTTTDDKTLYNMTDTRDQTHNMDYHKEGTKNVDFTKETTEDLKQNIVGNELVTRDLQGTLDEDITSHQTTTTDMKTETDSTTDGTANVKTTGMKQTDFSDIPQAGIETETTYKPDGSYTVTTHGYLTTQTIENTTENSDTVTHEEGHSVTTNTGTVDVDGTSNRQQETTDTGTINTDTTNDKTNDNTINEVSNEVTKWTEDGNQHDADHYDEAQHSDTYNLVKGDEQRNVIHNLQQDRNTASKSTTSENETVTHFTKGRHFSPSELIKQYRDILLNIDLMVIEELEPLFMGVY